MPGTMRPSRLARVLALSVLSAAPALAQDEPDWSSTWRPLPPELAELRTERVMRAALAPYLVRGTPLRTARASLEARGFTCSEPRVVLGPGVRPEEAQRLLHCRHHTPGDPDGLRAWLVTFWFRRSVETALVDALAVTQPDFLERYGQSLQRDGAGADSSRPRARPVPARPPVRADARAGVRKSD